MKCEKAILLDTVYKLYELHGECRVDELSECKEKDRSIKIKGIISDVENIIIEIDNDNDEVKPCNDNKCKCKK